MENKFKKMKDRNKRQKFCGELDRAPVVGVRRGCFMDVSVPVRECVCPLTDVFTREHACIRCVPPISRVTNQTWPDRVSQWKLVAGRWNTDTPYKEPPYYQHPLVNVSQLCICFIYRSCRDILCNRIEFIFKNETM